MSQDLHTICQMLLEDFSFVRWVTSDFEEDDAKWTEYIDNHPAHIEEMNTAIRIIQSFQLADNAILDEGALWNRIRSDIGLSENTNRRSGFIYSMNPKWIWFAAACLLFVCIAFWALPGTKTMETSNGEELTFTLPDGSTVHLGAASTVHYTPDEWKHSRQLTLNGFAFFDVKKGSSFEVQTERGKVNVLGTSFSVQSRNAFFEVICRTGKVRVTNNQGQVQLLLPGEKTQVDETTGALSKGNTDDIEADIPWLEGVYTFDNALLKDVANEIQFQYNVEIQLDETLAERKYTGFFKRGNLETALQSVFWPLNLTYTMDGKNIRVYTQNK
jgi:transmembrane sensor